MRIMLMPGARMLKIVMMKLIAGGHRGDTEHLQAEHQKSTLRPGFQAFSVSGA